MELYIDEKTQRAIKKFPHRALDIVQSYDSKQVACKQWLYNKLVDLNIAQPRRIYIAGSWYGNILVPLLRKIYSCEIRLEDIDEEVLKIAKNIYFHDDELIKISFIDSTSIEHKYITINTSCEHMKPLNIRKGSIVVLQSNNYREIQDHINCVDSCEELADQYNVIEEYYSGQLQFEKYTRYMVIGKV